jgi:hypothetical protein
MKRIFAISAGFLFLSLLAGGLTPVLAQTEGHDRLPAVQLVSYEIVRLELKNPVRLRDSEGKEQSYDRAYLVTLKGTFPRNQGLGMELYIGDYRVPEYGGSRDGIYFRIYDDRLLARLEGKEFRYRFASKEIRSLDMRFSLKSKGSLKVEKEP